MALGFSLCTLQACSDEDGTTDNETTVDPTNDYGKIKGNSLVATGGYRNVKPLRATILSSINTEYQGAYISLGVEFTPSQPNFNSSETRRVESYSGITNGHFETDLAAGGEGLLEPGTTYYYRAYANMGGSRYNGETRSFVTPDLQLSEGELVDLGLSVKWATCNMGANAPEVAGTLLQQCYAFENFNNVDRQNKFPLLLDMSTSNATGTGADVPKGIDDDNWLGNPDYDVATHTLGSKYRIPTEWEWKELEEEAYWKSGVYNDVKGFYISDRADGTVVIFLPYVKKSSKHDITVYLSAPDDIIWNFRRVMELESQYFMDFHLAQSKEERKQRHKQCVLDRLQLEKKLQSGEVLTENTHIYCEHGPILRVFDSKYASDLSDLVSEFDWTHPMTGKEYNFYEENGVNGGGVLYVRPVSNR